MAVKTKPKTETAGLPFTRHVRIQIAGEAIADIKTVEKVLRGEPVRGSVAERIKNSCRSRGYTPA